jgi:outer membrane protein TolC
MKRLLVVLLLLPQLALAQSGSFQRKNVDQERMVRQYEERLVQMAFQNAKNLKIFEKEVALSELSVEQAKINLLQGIGLRLNLNEGNISDQANPNLFFPRYNLSASISLGDIFGQKYERKAAEHTAEMARVNYELEKAKLRELVLILYKEYQVNLEILKNRTQAVDDAQSTQSLIAQQFRSGSVSLVDYNRSQEAYNNALDGKFRAEYQLYASKVALETLIGTPLERVIIKR